MPVIWGLASYWSRMTGQLGVEHVIISADIRFKRSNISKNVRAWMRKPDLATIPLFMAGDKDYFYWAARLQKDYQLPSTILCENMLERTNFKSGFAGIEPNFDSNHTYSMGVTQKLGLALRYSKAFAMNPAYINSSLIDTFRAFLVYYFLPRDFINMFDYHPWDEDEVNQTLIGQYDWETSPDSPSTWRIGDGTAAFYNYIYCTVAGFTEFDTFRSNQIREGVLDRETALTLALDENEPRLDSLAWYLDILGINFAAALKAIHEMPRLHPVLQA
jgi:glucosamine--fructose-6-phosphate aminotransferase (isomerizing)